MAQNSSAWVLRAIRAGTLAEETRARVSHIDPAERDEVARRIVHDTFFERSPRNAREIGVRTALDTLNCADALSLEKYLNAALVADTATFAQSAGDTASALPEVSFVRRANYATAVDCANADAESRAEEDDTPRMASPVAPSALDDVDILTADSGFELDASVASASDPAPATAAAADEGRAETAAVAASVASSVLSNITWDPCGR